MLRPFLPPPGINSDDTTFSQEGRWADGNNVRFRLGKPETVGGLVSKFDLGSGGAVDLFAFIRSGTPTIAYGLSADVLIGTALTSATNRLSVGAVNSGFSFAAWGNTLLAACYGEKLYDQSGTSSAAEVTEAPDRIDAGILVTPERQVLAFATNEVGGTWNGLCIRGSDLEDYSSAGSWTPAASNNAFEHILDGPGVIVAKAQIGPYVAVWTTGALYLGQFIGDPAQTYRFDKVAEVPAPMAKRAVTQLNGVVYWMGVDLNLRAWAPGGQPTVIPCPIMHDARPSMADVATNQKFAYLIANTAFNEVWFCYNDTRDVGFTTATRYLAYAVDESTLASSAVWFRGHLERSSMLDSELVRAIDTTTGLSVLGAASDGEVYLHENKTTSISGAYIQSADFYLDESQRRMMIRSIVTDFEAMAGNVALTLYVRDRPLSSATTKGPYTLAEGAPKKDFRASGKIVSAKFAASSTATLMRLGKPLFDVVPLGER